MEKNLTDAVSASAAESSSPWSFRVATVAGIPIRVHVTLLILLAWFGFTAGSRGESSLQSLLFVSLLFVFVAIHELGHAAMARRFGVKTRDIVLYPIGGVARLEGMPRGLAELLIALAGPSVNLLLAGLIVAAMLILAVPLLIEGQELMLQGHMLHRLLAVNLGLFAFNLIPAFPMDGGRVLRAGLSLAVGQERATTLAARTGQGLAVLGGLISVFTGAWALGFVSLFILLGASQELRFSKQSVLVMGHTARDAMITRFETLAPQDSVGRAVEHLLATHQQDFPVVDAWERVTGVICRGRLIEGIAAGYGEKAVLELMLREVPVVGPDTDLARVLAHFQAQPGLPVLVIEDDKLSGMITLENLVEFMQVARFVEKRS